MQYDLGFLLTCYTIEDASEFAPRYFTQDQKVKKINLALDAMEGE